MSLPFPSAAWLEAAVQALNQDDRYAQVARRWEGDCLFEVMADSGEERLGLLHFDLWHGRCRDAHMVDPATEGKLSPAFVISATRRNFLRVLQGELDPIQAMLTRRLRVHGSMAYMLRNVPTVLEFVRVVSGVAIEPG